MAVLPKVHNINVLYRSAWALYVHSFSSLVGICNIIGQGKALIFIIYSYFRGPQIDLLNPDDG